MGTLVTTCWHFSTPTGRVLSCRIFKMHEHDERVEVRLGYDASDVLYSRSTFEWGTARDIAAELKVYMQGKKGFTEVTDATPTAGVR